MQAPAWKMGTSKRVELGKTSNTKAPGPGAQSQEAFVKLTGKGRGTTSSFSFGHDKRINMDKVKAKDLGPGSYETRSFIAEGPAFSARIRSADMYKSKMLVPGPGAYSLGTTKTNISFSIGSRFKDARKTTNVPGPGNYNANYNQTETVFPNWKIGSSKRNSNYSSNSPGPGKYGENDQQLVGVKTKAPNWVIGKEVRGRDLSPTKNFPGPGAQGVKSLVGDLPSYARN